MSKRTEPFLSLPCMPCPGRGLWLGFKRNKGMLVDRKQILSAALPQICVGSQGCCQPAKCQITAAQHSRATLPPLPWWLSCFNSCVIAGVKPVLLTQSICFLGLMWGIIALGVWGSICRSGPPIDQSARAIPEPKLWAAMGMILGSLPGS